MNATNAIASMVFLAGLSVLWLWLYRDYRTDVFRHRLFRLREELFSLAQSGEIGFDNPSYGALRSTVNGFLRFGDRISLSWAIALWFAERKQNLDDISRGFDTRWKAGQETLTDETRAKLEVLRRRVHEQVTEQLVLTSPFLAVGLLFLVLVIAILRSILPTRLWMVAKRRFQTRADAAAYAEGCLA